MNVNLRVLRNLAIGFAVAVLLMPNVFAQSVELSPYFGGVWPDSSSAGEIKTNALWGVRAGFHFDNNFSLDGNFGYLNHFEVKGTDPKSRGFLYEIEPTYSFSSEDWPLPSSFTPYLSAGVGGITTSVSDPDRFTYNTFETVQFVGAAPLTRVRPIEVSSGDTFFTMSGGGGFKINPRPIGFRADIRARVLPNYYKASPVWLEATVGISFVLGRR